MIDKGFVEKSVFLITLMCILAGMGVIAWLLRRSLRGDFSPDYFGPVDYVGLYWHLVDLVWIYLFPLLYLIR